MRLVCSFRGVADEREAPSQLEGTQLLAMAGEGHSPAIGPRQLVREVEILKQDLRAVALSVVRRRLLRLGERERSGHERGHWEYDFDFLLEKESMGKRMYK